LVFLVIGAIAAVAADDARYLWGLPLAWAVCAAVAAGYLTARGDVARHFEHSGREVTAQALLSLAAAMVTIPAVVAFAAALRLEDATVCTKTALSTDVAYQQHGKFIGETNERLYIGTERHPEGAAPHGVPPVHPESVTSIPNSEIARVVIGRDKQGTVECRVAAKKP
jgi:hypothetical protein